MLQWVDIVPEVSKRVAELLRIMLDKTEFCRYVDECLKTPFVKMPDFSRRILR